MVIRLERKHIVWFIAALAFAGFVAGLVWFVFANQPPDAEAAYYRGIFDLCRSMVIATEKWIDCQVVAQTARDAAWYEQDSAGWVWPIE